MLLDYFFISRESHTNDGLDSELSCSSDDEPAPISTVATITRPITPIAVPSITPAKLDDVATALTLTTKALKPKKQYHYFLNGKLKGPASKEEIVALHASHNLSSDTSIWIKRAKKATAKWRKLKVKNEKRRTQTAKTSKASAKCESLDCVDSVMVWCFATVTMLHLTLCTLLVSALLTVLSLCTKLIKFHLYGENDGKWPFAQLRVLSRLRPITVLYQVPRLLFERSAPQITSDEDNDVDKLEVESPKEITKKTPKKVAKGKKSSPKSPSKSKEKSKEEREKERKVEKAKARKMADMEMAKEIAKAKEREFKLNTRLSMMAFMVWGEAADLISLAVIAFVMFVLSGQPVLYAVLLFPIAMDLGSMTGKSAYYEGLDSSVLVQSLIADLLVVLLGLISQPWGPYLVPSASTVGGLPSTEEMCSAVTTNSTF